MDINPEALEIHQDAERVRVRALEIEGWTFPPVAQWTPGSIVISRDMVMQSNAGHYIGQSCYEFTDFGDESIPHEWVGPMPYKRDTDYMSLEDAQSLLELQRDVHPTSVMTHVVV